MMSHEYARQLQKTVDHLLSRPDVALAQYAEPHLFISFWSEKDDFIAAARAMGSGTKVFNGSDLYFKPEGTCLTFSIGRDKVCRKVQEEKWECEPLLSDNEVEQLGVSETVPTDNDIPF